MKITGSAGHSALAQGARYKTLREHVITRRINKELQLQCKARGVEFISSTSNAPLASSVLLNQVKMANASGADLAISHHLNAGGGTGFEVWYDAGDSRSAAIAEKVSAALAKHYGMKNRGAKPDSANRYGSLYFLSKTKMPAILIEWGFIDSRNDMDKILADIPSGVDALLEALGAPQKRVKYKVTRENGIFLYRTASKRAMIKGKLRNAQVVEMVIAKTLWAKVQTENGTLGWVVKRYLKKA
jgi:N-acetylmuramoyl-L-alanine amidase